MIQQSLNGHWTLNVLTQQREPVFSDVSAQVPGSVYTDCLAAGLIGDPFYRDQELDALKLMEHRFIYTRTFAADPDLGRCDAVLLRCFGLDTLASVYLNDRLIDRTDNMHRTYEYAVDDYLRDGENEIRIEFDSPTRFIREAWDEAPINGADDAMRGFPYLRKAHCMFGWDWGPRLPDAGIWRPIELVGIKKARISQVYIWQDHSPEQVMVDLDIETEDWSEQDGVVSLRTVTTLSDPEGHELLTQENDSSLVILQPRLWWPRGYGEQPLYTITVKLYAGDDCVDIWQRRIGLRTVTVSRQPDEWGESFAHEINGVKLFAMGADYIPEDNLTGRLNPARTRRLLEDAVLANFNTIRVWGGGYYPEDWFFDICDELGLLVWQDFMFACANYELTPEFKENIRQECIDNVIRLRHHASLALWCGNNEMEMFQANERFDPTPSQKADYIRMFEYLIPEILEAYDPQTFYWPASPSSGGGFDEPNDPNRGDVHYWDVWHGDKPFSDYRNYHFRYASEFGFQAFPSLKTVKTFTEPSDRNIFSRVMEMHQRNKAANGKILNYMSATYLYPKDFDHLLYASQLLQAEAIQYGVEHWRRHRGRCMGAIYWQLNDCWPVASWSSIDSLGRWKALHYYARRFFAPVMISCEENGEMTQRRFVNEEPHEIQLSASIAVANEQRRAASGVVRWALVDADDRVIRHDEAKIEVPALSSVWLPQLHFTEAEATRHYLSYEFISDGDVVSRGSVLFCAPKHFPFRDPQLSWQLDGDLLTVKANHYARCIEIEDLDSDLLLSDNYFHLNGGESCTVRILRGQPSSIRLRSVFDIAEWSDD